ncbi:MAG: hypothetical protein OSJ70_05455 [Bacilli bacterium]|nr:hypothetical protein [Bacilli bacterium]
MDPKIAESVSRFVEELKKRIELLTSTTTRANLNEDSYNAILDIINSYIHTAPSRLTVDELIKIKIDDMEKILDLIGLKEDEKNKILLVYNSNVYSIQNTSLQTRIVELSKYFEDIIKMILDYVTDYEEIHNNQEELQSTKVSEYRHLIDVLTRENFSKLFEEEEIDKLLKLMTNFAIPVSDRQHIMQYIAMQNLKVPVLDNDIFDEDYVNLLHHVTSVVDKHLIANSEEKDIIKKELENMDIDIDLIPSIAKEIAEKHGLKYNLTKNIISALILNSLFNSYTRAIEADESEEFIESFKSKINDVLNIELVEDNRIIEEARAILADKQEFYVNSVEMDDDVNQYVGLLISEIEDMGYDYETAVDYKTLPLIKSMSETLDKIDKLDSENPDYNLCIDMLNQLLEAYNKLLEKKGIKKY